LLRQPEDIKASGRLNAIDVLLTVEISAAWFVDISEIMWVGKRFFVSTPNRWFPLEHHTGIPFLYFLPMRLFRGLIRNTRYSYWFAE
jgi:hypothetical protein